MNDAYVWLILAPLIYLGAVSIVAPLVAAYDRVHAARDAQLAEETADWEGR